MLLSCSCPVVFTVLSLYCLCLFTEFVFFSIFFKCIIFFIITVIIPVTVIIKGQNPLMIVNLKSFHFGCNEKTKHLNIYQLSTEEVSTAGLVMRKWKTRPSIKTQSKKGTLRAAIDSGFEGAMEFSSWMKVFNDIKSSADLWKEYIKACLKIARETQLRHGI